MHNVNISDLKLSDFPQFNCLCELCDCGYDCYLLIKIQSLIIFYLGVLNAVKIFTQKHVKKIRRKKSIFQMLLIWIQLQFLYLIHYIVIRL
jgi:hypothetical protein